MENNVNNLIEALNIIEKFEPKYIIYSISTYKPEYMYEEFWAERYYTKVIIGFAFSENEADEYLEKMNIGYKKPKYFKTPYRSGIINSEKLIISEKLLKFWFDKSKINKIIENRKIVLMKK